MSAQDKYSLQERGRFKAWWDAARPLEGSAFPYEIAWAAWQAALSAQPSPGGQGDAPVSLPLYRLADDANGNRGLHRDDTGSWVKLQDVERALAARQPMGHVPAGFVLMPEKFGIPADVWEGVEFVIGGPGTGEGEAYLDSTAWIGDLMQDDGSSVYGLHLSCDECPEEGSVTLSEFPAAPAQAVDLGQFRGLAEFGEEFAFSAQKQPQSRVIYAQARRLLALIDSQAAGNGN